jgi:hypothetical protein
MRILILIGILLIAPVLTAGDTVYQWTDKDGNTHYSGQPPPPGSEWVERTLEPLPNVGTVDPYLDADDIEKVTTEQLAQENADLVQRRLDATTYDEQRSIECDVAQNVIDKLSAGRLAKIVSADGTLRVLSDAEREDRLRTSEKYIDENCR